MCHRQRAFPSSLRARASSALICLFGAASSVLALDGDANAQEAPAGAVASVTPPVVLQHVDAVYPPSALPERKHADVVLAVTVDADGHVSKVEVAPVRRRGPRRGGDGRGRASGPSPRRCATASRSRAGSRCRSTSRLRRRRPSSSRRPRRPTSSRSTRRRRRGARARAPSPPPPAVAPARSPRKRARTSRCAGASRRARTVRPTTR